MNSFVVDVGSDTIRIGYSGDKKPKRQILNFLASQKEEEKEKKYKSFYIGKDFLDIKEKCKFDISYPMEKGLIRDFDKMTQIFEKTFNTVGVDNGDKFLLSDSHLTPKKDRETITQYIFEDVSASMFYLMKIPSMTMYSTGNQSGLVLNSGADHTNTVAVYEGFILPQSSFSTDIGGRTITNSIINHLSKFNFCSVDRIPRDIKEKLCYISPYDTSKDLKEYVLPDSTSISLEDVSSFTECLFNGIDSKNTSIQEILNKSILSLDQQSICEEFSRNLVLSGGNCLLKGFEDRLLSEMNILNGDFEYKTVKTEDKLNSTWLGGSVASKSFNQFGL
eukprot:gene2723-3919_t